MAILNTARSVQFGFVLVIPVLVFATRATSLAREWTDSTGSYRTEAEFRGFTDGLVALEKTGGIAITVAFERLSASDQQYVLSQVEQLRSAADSFDVHKREGFAWCKEGDWNRGMVALTQSKDSELSRLAKVEISLTNPSDDVDGRATKIAELVRGWRLRAERHSDDEPEIALQRSEYWRVRAEAWRLVQWGESMLGRKIGNGQCTEIPRYALTATGAETANGWGRRLAKNEPLLPGDILRLVAVEAKGYSTGSQHLAIIKRVLGPRLLEVYHQNSNGVQHVMIDTFDLNKIVKGSYEFYRPVFASSELFQ